MAEYYKGKTIDPDTGDKFLKIEGERYIYKKEDCKFYYVDVHDKNQSYEEMDLIELGKKIIDNHKSQNTLEDQRCEHIRELDKGVASWNSWRNQNPHIRPILYGLPENEKYKDKLTEEHWRKEKENQEIWGRIKSSGLQEVNFSNANLIEADLADVNLTKANFHEANLGGAKLIRTNLIGANFCRTDLYKTDLSEANLTYANLQGAQIAGTILKGTTIENCKVYGSSAWGIDLKDTKQKNLEIVYQKAGDKTDTKLMVNDLGMAQFLYFILHNKHLLNFFNSTGSSLVLLLGSFEDEEKKVLDELRNSMQNSAENKYIPLLFDFEKPENYDYTRIITVLAGMSKFIIADLTNAKSVPHELHAIVGACPTPIIPIIKSSDESKAEPFSMFADYYKYYWIHPVIKYPSSEILQQYFDKLFSAAETFYESIKKIRAETEIKSVSIDKI